jgi:hypothetical protein
MTSNNRFNSFDLEHQEGHTFVRMGVSPHTTESQQRRLVRAAEIVKGHDREACVTDFGSFSAVTGFVGKQLVTVIFGQKILH